MKAKFRKGDLVRPVCTGDERIDRYRAIGLYTEQQRADSYSRHRGLDSAGEPIIPPRYYHTECTPEDIFIVLRARVKDPRTTRNVGVAWALVLSSRGGQELYIRHNHLVPVSGTPTTGDTTS